jgi:hypothetical protein
LSREALAYLVDAALKGFGEDLSEGMVVELGIIDDGV